MIKKEEVQHIAKLARMNLTDEEINKYQKELSLILDYIKTLDKADLLDVQLDSSLLERRSNENILREDEVRKENKTDNKELLALAPETKNNYLKVKPIF